MLVNLQRFPWKLPHSSYIIQRCPPPAQVLETFSFSRRSSSRAHSHRWSNLVAGLLEVVCEGGDDRGGVSSDLGLAVEADDDAGLGGSNGNTITALAI